ncbi:histidine phosphatase family protein [Candidatus Roizmanbacteria bacterium]|nr:histidine phosphatase family protein [Candidatus Roizmanbacteria bacterium]
MLKPNCRIFIIRHGLTDENIIPYSHLHTAKLTEEGKRQTEKTANILRNIKFDVILSANTNYAKDTSTIVANIFNASVQYCTDLNERNIGNISNTQAKDLNKNYLTLKGKDAWDYKLNDNIESFAEAYRRIIKFIKFTSKKNSGQTVCMVSHGLLMRILLGGLGYIPYQKIFFTTLINAGYIELECARNKVEIKSVFGLKDRTRFY